MGFVRGEQFAEIIANDPVAKELKFFLVKFEQGCNLKPQGCSMGDLLTPAVEKDWQKVTVYEDEDLGNTIFDCKQCHQPGGENTPKMLRMQELRNPWTHFIRDNNPGGQALTADFQSAHGLAENYGGIPAALIAASDPALLEDLVRDNGFGAQPNEFPTGTIEGEVRNTSNAQPQNNTVTGTSATWQRLYDQFTAGTFIAVPWHDVKVTDPQKLPVMAKAYRDFVAGTTGTAEMPDIRQVQSAEAIVGMGLTTKPGLTGNALLIQACSQCHNSKLPQDVSRSKFDVDLTKMSRSEKDLAMARIQLPDDDVKKMPPPFIRNLSKEGAGVLLEHLKQ